MSDIILTIGPIFESITKNLSWDNYINFSLTNKRLRIYSKTYRTIWLQHYPQKLLCRFIQRWRLIHYLDLHLIQRYPRFSSRNQYDKASYIFKSGKADFKMIVGNKSIVNYINTWDTYEDGSLYIKRFGIDKLSDIYWDKNATCTLQINGIDIIKNWDGHFIDSLHMYLIYFTDIKIILNPPKIYQIIYKGATTIGNKHINYDNPIYCRVDNSFLFKIVAGSAWAFKYSIVDNKLQLGEYCEHT